MDAIISISQRFGSAAPDGINVSDLTLSGIRTLHRRGAYDAAAAAILSLPPSAQRTPVVTLLLTRVYLDQGQLRRADSTIGLVNMRVASLAEKSTLALYSALIASADGNIVKALRMAKTALDEASTEPLSMTLAARANIQRLHTSVLLVGKDKLKVEPREARAACDDLPRITQELISAGWMDEALLAQSTYVASLPFVEQAAAYDELIALAVRCGCLAQAGTAHINKAMHLLASNRGTADITSELIAAERLFTDSDHAHGFIDVRYAKAIVALQREAFTGYTELEDCAVEYLSRHILKQATLVLLDLSHAAQERGDSPKLAGYTEMKIKTSSDAGYGFLSEAASKFDPSEMDRLLRSSDFSRLIDKGKALLQPDTATALDAHDRGLVEYGLSLGYKGVHDLKTAREHCRTALDGLERLGDSKSQTLASNIAAELVGQLTLKMTTTTDDELKEAERVLVKWIPLDEQRKAPDLAVTKLNQMASIAFHRGMQSQGMEFLDRAAALTTALPRAKGCLARGDILQSRARHLMRNDRAGNKRLLLDAIQMYEEGGFRSNAAFCHQAVGFQEVDLSREVLQPHFAEAESHLQIALASFEDSGMLDHAAEASFMLATLYTNQCSQALRLERTAAAMIATALALLNRADSHYDTIRREFLVSSTVDSWEGKRQLSLPTNKVYNLAYKLLVHVQPQVLASAVDVASVWKWVQRAKSRALAVTVGSGTVIPRRILESLTGTSLKLVEEEQGILQALHGSDDRARPGLRAWLTALRERMQSDLHLTEYLQVRSGAIFELLDLQSFLAAELSRGCSVACVDWFSIDEELYILLVSHEKDEHGRFRPPVLCPLSLKVGDVDLFVRSNLSEDALLSTLLDNPLDLREMDALIAPLQQHTHREQLLVLSPTGSLHHLPLHALELNRGVSVVERKALVEWNPLVYCSSLSVLRQCLSRTSHQRLIRRGDPLIRLTVALFGDSRNDRKEAADAAKSIGKLLQVAPLLGVQVTKEAFKREVRGRRHIVHFQGHARHNPIEPLLSHLELAGQETLTAREVFDLQLNAVTVVLAACQSASAVIERGDEPVGLLSAFLLAGADSVMATQWKVSADAAGFTMTQFYTLLLDKHIDHGNHAQMLRKAVLATRREQRFSTPYFWAAFSLHGAWSSIWDNPLRR